MHVIVGQGQLEAILHATAEERRGFIEEAAGVLKHRKRKEKALRKLEATDGNLTRLADLLGEIRRQLKPLGRQAEVARRASVVQMDVRDAAARLLADDVVTMRAAQQQELADEEALQASRLAAQTGTGHGTRPGERARRAARGPTRRGWPWPRRSGSGSPGSVSGWRARRGWRPSGCATGPGRSTTGSAATRTSWRPRVRSCVSRRAELGEQIGSPETSARGGPRRASAGGGGPPRGGPPGRRPAARRRGPPGGAGPAERSGQHACVAAPRPPTTRSVGSRPRAPRRPTERPRRSTTSPRSRPASPVSTRASRGSTPSMKERWRWSPTSTSASRSNAPPSRPPNASGLRWRRAPRRSTSGCGARTAQPRCSRPANECPGCSGRSRRWCRSAPATRLPWPPRSAPRRTPWPWST